jgi:hypothetical protein
MENLTATPIVEQSEPSASGSEDAFEFDPKTTRRLSGGSMSSGSEISVRQSLDENFRGLFYRPPNVPSPEAYVRRRRLPSHLPQNLVLPTGLPSTSPQNTGLAHSKTSTSTSTSTFELNSPHGLTELSEGSAFELRTPVMGETANQPKASMHRSPLSSSNASLDPHHVTGPAAGTLAVPPNASPLGLGVSFSPGSTNFLAGFDNNRIDVGRQPQPLAQSLARDDSWITECESCMHACNRTAQ